jgi:hypothetical protein
VGTGTKTLLVGSGNVFDIVVTAGDGTTQRTYTVTVTREPSDNANLSALTVSVGTLSPVFHTHTFAYEVKVAYIVESITIGYVTNESNATVTGAGEHALVVGDNLFMVEITAEDGISKGQYVVKVTRYPNTDTSLATLRVSHGTLTPVFKPEQLEYTTNIAFNTLSITIVATANHDKATVTGTGVKSLDDDTFEITVTAEDGLNKQTYILKVVRDMLTNSHEIDIKQPLKAWSSDGILNIEGLTIGKSYRIYNVVGSLIHQGIANSYNVQVALPIQGIYIIQSENNVLKISF